MKKHLAALLVAWAAFVPALPLHAVEPPESYAAAPSTNEDRAFLKKMREALAAGREIASGEAWPSEKDFAATSFPKKNHGVILVMNQPGTSRVRSIATRSSDAENIRRVVNAAVQNERFSLFDVRDPDRCRIQIDFITAKPETFDLKALSQSAVGPKRFEMGVDGFLAVHGKTRYYFLPGDAFVKSYLYFGQVGKELEKRFKNVPPAEMEFYRFRTRSFVSYKDAWIALYRGYPVQGPPEALNAATVRARADAGVDYLVQHQEKDGRFLYYYDAAADSFRDHEHPKRDPKKDAYFNELRHTAGTIILFLQYEKTKDPKLIEAARSAIEWTLKHVVREKLADGRPSAYLFYNQKSKLGGAGILLYVLSRYQAVTGDARYAETAAAVKNHLLAQVTDSGEFIYYNIYLDKPITEKENRNYFSFYYPGEAICGLAAYYKYVETDAKAKAEIQKKMQMAINFLVDERPKVYASYFAPLPSDSWLMLGINELWDVPELQKDSYKKFVFDDADKMVEHMYKRKDALYPDYFGAYYYVYGDFPYADGARDEGLQAAYELAVKAKDKRREKAYFDAAKAAAWAAIHLTNTAESVYSVPNPAMSIGGIRFKHTRQWFRVDTIAHVCAFYLRFVPYLEREESKT